MSSLRSQPWRLGLALAVSLAGLAGAAPGRAAIVTPYSAVGSEAVVAGVAHEWGTTQTDAATQQINVLRVDAGAPGLHFETGMPDGQVNGRQRTSDQAVAATHPGHRVVGAVNGDFWHSSPSKVWAPSGLNVRDGELLAANDGGRSALGFDNHGRPMIGQPRQAFSLTLPDESTLRIAGVNQLRDSDQLILYTPRFGPSTATDAAGVEAILSGAPSPLPVSGDFRVTVDLVRRAAGDTPLAAGKVVLSAVGAAAASLALLTQGDEVGLSLSIDPAWANVITAIGGGALLVHDGVVATTFDQPNELTANPRTAAGIGADGGVILVTADGRSESSGGMALADLAQVMSSLGAIEALNLDGGGSTTMVVDPDGAAPLAVANRPSGPYERRVNTTLQVVSTTFAAPTVSPPIVRIRAGVETGKSDAAVLVSWRASDTDGNIVGTELQQLTASGTWRDVTLSDPVAATIDRRFVFSLGYRFRVRVTDNDGNTSPWVVGLTYRLLSINEGAPELQRSGRWSVDYQPSAIGRHLARSSIKSGMDQSIALLFTGVQVAWVAPTSPLGGAADVSVNGAATTTVDLHSAVTRPRVVLFVAPPIDVASGVTPPQRTVEVLNASARSRPYVDIDAFVVLTTD